MRVKNVGLRVLLEHRLQYLLGSGVRREPLVDDGDFDWLCQLYSAAVYARLLWLRLTYSVAPLELSPSVKAPVVQHRWLGDK